MGSRSTATRPLVQTLLRHDLIDEYRIAVHPLVLGRGAALFRQPGVATTFELAAARTLDSGVVNLTYVRPARDET